MLAGKIPNSRGSRGCVCSQSGGSSFQHTHPRPFLAAGSQLGACRSTKCTRCKQNMRDPTIDRTSTPTQASPREPNCSRACGTELPCGPLTDTDSGDVPFSFATLSCGCAIPLTTCGHSTTRVIHRCKFPHPREPLSTRLRECIGSAERLVSVVWS